MTVGSQVKQTLADIKGVQAALRIYLTQTPNDETKAAYEEAWGSLGQVINDLEARVRTLEFEEPQYKGN